MKDLEQSRETEKEALAALLLETMHVHPRPWRIDMDWSAEIVDREGEVVAKLPDSKTAQFIIDLAVEFDNELKKIDEESQAMADEAAMLPKLGPEWRD